MNIIDAIKSIVKTKRIKNSATIFIQAEEIDALVYAIDSFVNWDKLDAVKRKYLENIYSQLISKTTRGSEYTNQIDRLRKNER